jgi:hypothetical protein
MHLKRDVPFILILPLAALLLSGCNLPRPAPASSTPDAVATQVSTLLAGMPTADLVSTATPPPPTATPAAATITPSPSPAVVQDQNDPRAALGDPDYRDTFSKANLWGLDDPYDDSHTRVEIKDNRLILTSLKAEGWKGWRTTFPEPGDAYIEGDFTTGPCSGGDQYGLVFRSADKTASFFGVTCDGRYSLTYFDGSQFTRVLDWQSATALNTGSNQTNRLGVWLDGSNVRLYANGILLSETDVDGIQAQGNYGAYISSINTPQFTVSLTEIAHWELE